MTRRQSFTVAAVALNLAVALALLRVLESVAWPSIAGLLVHFGLVR